MTGLAATALAATTAGAEEIGEVTTAIKILGANHRIVVEAFDDPKVEGVACFVSRARTGGISGSLGIAEDTSDASINCQQTGPVSVPRRAGGRRGGVLASRQRHVQAGPGRAVLRPDAQRAGLPHLFRQADRGLAEEQRLGRGDPRLAVSAPLLRAAGAGDAGRRRPGRSGPARGGAALAPRRWRRTAAATCALPRGPALPGGDRRHGLARRSASGCGLPGCRSTRSWSRRRPTSRNASIRSRRRSSSGSAFSAGGSTITSRR